MPDVAAGNRVRFLSHGEPEPNPLASGEEGTVARVGRWHEPLSPSDAAWRQISVTWDSGRRLMLVDPVDDFEVVT